MKVENGTQTPAVTSSTPSETSETAGKTSPAEFANILLQLSQELGNGGEGQGSASGSAGEAGGSGESSDLGSTISGILGGVGSSFGGGDGQTSPMSTNPEVNPLGNEGAQGATSTTQGAGYAEQDFAKSIDNLHSSHQDDFAVFQKHANDGNGNAMVNDIVNDYKKGDISKSDANALAVEVQQVANVNGGGKINKKERTKLETDLGNSDDVITNGHTRGADWWKEHGSQFLGAVGLAGGVIADAATKKA